MASNYPMGADTKNAPWNEETNEPIKITVAVSITLSKSVVVEVDDYEKIPDIDEEGHKGYEYNFDNCDLKKAVIEQIDVPLQDWCVDDFEVMKE